MQKTYHTLYIFLFVFLYLFVLNYFAPPQGDDWNYILSSKDGYEAGFRIFMTWNSRVGELVWASIFSQMNNHIFDFFNAFVGAVFVYLFFYLCFSSMPKSLRDFSIIVLILLLLLLLLNFEEIFLWGSGSLNYLWGFMVGGILLLPIRYYLNDLHSINRMPLFMDSKWFYVVFFVFSIIVGMWHEATSSLMLASLVLLFIYTKFVLKIKIPLWYYIGFLGLFIGFCILYFSPGQNVRIQAESQIRDYISIKDFLLLSLMDKLHRIYLVLHNACSNNPIFFPLFGFIVIYLRMFGKIFSHIILNIALFVIAFICYILILFELPVVSYILLLGMFIYIYFKTKDKLYLVAFCLLGMWFIGILSTFQLLSLPFRARTLGVLLLIAIIILFVSRHLFSNKRQYVLIFVGILYFAYVGFCYYQLNTKWNNLVDIVNTKKANYKGDLVPIHLRAMNRYDVDFMGYGLDIVIPKEDYSFTYRGFGPWWKLSSDPKDDINQSYALIFRIQSIRVE